MSRELNMNFQRLIWITTITISMFVVATPAHADDTDPNWGAPNTKNDRVLVSVVLTQLYGEDNVDGTPMNTVKVECALALLDEMLVDMKKQFGPLNRRLYVMAVERIFRNFGSHDYCELTSQ